MRRPIWRKVTEMMKFNDFLGIERKFLIFGKNMKREHQKRGNQQKVHFHHLRKCDLRTGFGRRMEIREAPGGQSVEFGGIQ